MQRIFTQHSFVLIAAFMLAVPPEHARAQDSGLTGIIGIGTSYGPDYFGSDDDSTSVFPIINLTWRNRYFLNDKSLGFYALRDRGAGKASLGFALGYDFDERLQEDDPRLAGLTDVEASALLTAFFEYEWGPADIAFELNRGIGSDGHEGTRAKLAAEFSAPVGDRLTLSAQPFVVWANGPYAQAFYGVSASEAASSSFSEYSAGAGLERIGLELSATYAVTEKTGVFLGVTHARLMGDARDSPIVLEENQTAISTGLFFRF